MSNFKTTRFLLEIFSIIFAVLLALALDSWRENIKEKAIIEESLEDIFIELVNMNNLSNSIIQFNQNILDNLDSAIIAFTNGKEVDLRPFGLGRPEIRDLAWSTSRENGIATGYDRTLFLDLAEVYIEFDRLESILDYNREFRLKSDPNMSKLTTAKHIRKQISQAIFRCKEVGKKSGIFLEKYKDSPYMPR